MTLRLKCGFAAVWLLRPALVLALLSPALPAGANDCPVGQDGGVHISIPTTGVQNLSGVLQVQFTRPNIPSGSIHSWYGINLLRVARISGMGQETYIDEVFATPVSSSANGTEFVATWPSGIEVNDTYRFYAICVFTTNGVRVFDHDQCWSNPVTFTTENPNAYRRGDEEGLHCSCKCDSVATGSSTSPLTGHQSFTIPMTSWQYQGATFSFGLQYSSHALVDPTQSPEPPNFAGLSERNSHWRHPYAMWVDLFKDEAGVKHAVWHRPEGVLSFQKSGSAYLSSDSYHSVTAGGGTVTSPSFGCDGGEVISKGV
jgi:hypothetical protein